MTKPCQGGRYILKNGELRLSSYPAGRLEIYLNGAWGTICDDLFGPHAASLACRLLGYDGATASYAIEAYYGQGSGQIWLDDLRCYGHETSMLECLNNGWGVHNCQHTEDVGVSCTGLRPIPIGKGLDRTCRDYTVRRMRL